MAVRVRNRRHFRFRALTLAFGSFVLLRIFKQYLEDVMMAVDNAHRVETDLTDARPGRTRWSRVTYGPLNGKTKSALDHDGTSTDLVHNEEWKRPVDKTKSVEKRDRGLVLITWHGGKAHFAVCIAHMNTYGRSEGDYGNFTVVVNRDVRVFTV